MFELILRLRGQLPLAGDVGQRRSTTTIPQSPRARRRIRHRDGHLAPRADDARARRVAAPRQGALELRHQRGGAARVLGRGHPPQQGTTRSIVTLGMRGDGDEPMSSETQRRAARAHRRRPAQHPRPSHGCDPDVTQVPQVWALYKEVQDYYEKGMRVPDDVTLLWCDDNWGNIRRLPTPEERKPRRRRGHLLPLRLRRRPAHLQVDQHRSRSPKVWEQMHLAWQLRRRRGSGSSTSATSSRWSSRSQFFLDYAWDPARWPAERLHDYTRAVGRARVRRRARGRDRRPRRAATRSSTAGASRSCSSRARTAWSTTARRRRVVADYNAAGRARRADRTTALPADVPRRLLPARAAIRCKACADAERALRRPSGRNRLYAAQGRATTNDLARARARAVRARTPS